MKKKSLGQVFMNGILNENPTFRLLLGMCPTLAMTTAASQGLGMGLSTTFVLVFSNLVISAFSPLSSPRSVCTSRRLAIFASLRGILRANWLLF